MKFVSVALLCAISCFGQVDGVPVFGDLNADSLVDVLDVQLAINQALGFEPCGTADVDLDGACTVMDVQTIINAALAESEENILL